MSAPANGLFDGLTIFISVRVPFREKYKDKLTVRVLLPQPAPPHLTPRRQTAARLHRQSKQPMSASKINCARLPSYLPTSMWPRRVVNAGANASRYHVSYEWVDECVLQGKLLPYADFAIEPKSKGKGGKEVGRPAGRGAVGVKGGYVGCYC